MKKPRMMPMMGASALSCPSHSAQSALSLTSPNPNPEGSSAMTTMTIPIPSAASAARPTGHSAPSAPAAPDVSVPPRADESISAPRRNPVAAISHSAAQPSSRLGRRWLTASTQQATPRTATNGSATSVSARARSTPRQRTGTVSTSAITAWKRLSRSQGRRTCGAGAESVEAARRATYSRAAEAAGPAARTREAMVATAAVRAAIRAVGMGEAFHVRPACGLYLSPGRAC